LKHLRQLKKSHNERGRLSCDKNFMEINSTVQENLEVKKFRQTMNKMKAEDKLEEVKLRRQAIEKKKLEKAQFEMIKWNLYRIKVDQIEDDYADFKRN